MSEIFKTPKFQNCVNTPWEIYSKFHVCSSKLFKKSKLFKISKCYAYVEEPDNVANAYGPRSTRQGTGRARWAAWVGESALTRFSWFAISKHAREKLFQTSKYNPNIPNISLDTKVRIWAPYFKLQQERVCSCGWRTPWNLSKPKHFRSNRMPGRGKDFASPTSFSLWPACSWISMGTQTSV
jgi:hypothetical protein